MITAHQIEPMIPETDPGWQAFLHAPVDTDPVPEEVAAALVDPTSRTFIDGATVTAEVTRRSAAEE